MMNSEVGWIIILIQCTVKSHTRYEVFMAVEFQVVVFWIVMPCSVVVGYQCFRRFFCLHLQGEAARFSKMLASYCNTTWCHNPEDHNLNTVKPDFKITPWDLKVFLFQMSFHLTGTNFLIKSIVQYVIH
jgi:hypothetical protein